MASPLYSTIIIDLTKQIDLITEGFVKDSYDALSNALALPLASLCVLYIILKGYGITRGVIKTSMKELYELLFRIGLIFFLAMNWGNFSSYIVDFFVYGVGNLGAILIKATHTGTSSSSNGVMGGLQTAFTEVIEVGSWTIQSAGLKHLFPIVVGLIIYVCGFLIAMYALLELLVGKLMLSLCLGVAPIFIILTLFDATKSFFERWLGFLVGFSLIFVFVSGVLSLFISLIHWSIADHVTNHAANIGTVGWIPLAMVTGFCFVAIKDAVASAKHIGGACHTSSGASMAGTVARGLMKGTIGPKAITKKAKNLGKKMLAKTGIQPGGHLAKGIQDSMRRGD